MQNLALENKLALEKIQRERDLTLEKIQRENETRLRDMEARQADQRAKDQIAALQAQLDLDRLRRRRQPDQGPDCRLRRYRLTIRRTG